MTKHNNQFPKPGMSTDDGADIGTPLHPLSSTRPVSNPGNPAVELIRSKVQSAFSNSPDANEELLEAEAIPATQRSQHQQFIHELSNSGKSLAEIQSAWHNYYTNLSNSEKHKVWQEFYEQQALHSRYWQHVEPSETIRETKPHEPLHTNTDSRKSKHRHTARREPRSVSDVRSHLLNKISANGNLSVKHHLQSLLFGLTTASIAVLLILFSFFNERFLVPFINPSTTVASTPIITDPNNTAVGPEPLVIIPKINVEAPVVYDVTSTEEKAIQAGLERGVLHYGPSPNPGEKGNTVILGHSASNIFNRGKYKFAFILLKSLDNGDTFMLHKDGKRFVYKVFEKKVVGPNEVSVLGPASRASTATLITCDPPGLSTNRLVIVGEQITPDPSTNTVSKSDPTLAENISAIPSNSPTLWSRFLDWIR